MLLVVLMYALFAATFPLGKLALAGVSGPLFLTGIRMTLAGFLVLIYSSCTYGLGRVMRLCRDEAFSLTILAITSIYIAYGLEFWALKSVPSVKVNLFFSLSPFIAALLSYLLHRKQLSFQKAMGLAVGFVGMLVMVIHNPAQVEGLYGPISLQELSLLGAVASATYSWFLFEELLKRGVAIHIINGATMLLGGAMSWIHSRELWGVVEGAGVRFWTPFIALLVISNFVAYPLYGFLLKRYSQTLLSFAGFMCPLFGGIYGRVLLGEQLAWQYFVAFGAIFIGLALFYHAECMIDESSSKA